MEQGTCDWLAEERREVLESVAERLGSAIPADLEELAACSFLLQHLAVSTAGTMAAIN